MSISSAAALQVPLHVQGMVLDESPTRTTTSTQRLSPKRSSARTCASSRSRRTTSWTCKRSTGFETDRLEQIAASDAGCCRIRQIPGIGPIVATAIVAAIGNGAAFRKGRDFAAWLGLVPRQYSTGGKAKLLGISKRGNIYLRKVLIHGARAAAMRIKRDRFTIGTWMNALEARAPRNVLVVAMANKLARIAWAVLSTGEEYRPGVIATVAI